MRVPVRSRRVRHEKHKQKTDRMKKEFKALLLLLAGLFAAPGFPREPQAKAPPPAAAATFPDAYLAGTADFNLALQIQGDLRGNYGPCG
jgi:hypothetical protein